MDVPRCQTYPIQDIGRKMLFARFVKNSCRSIFVTPVRTWPICLYPFSSFDAMMSELKPSSVRQSMTHINAFLHGLGYSTFVFWSSMIQNLLLIIVVVVIVVGIMVGSLLERQAIGGEAGAGTSSFATAGSRVLQ
jgi:hypothetical protein